MRKKTEKTFACAKKRGSDARFSTEEEWLAWPVRPQLGEEDDPTVYPVPPVDLMSVLRKAKTRLELQAMWRQVAVLP